MKEITIGLCGLTLHSGNLGCSALAYSFIKVLADSYDGNINLIIYEKRPSNNDCFNDYNNFKNICHIEYHIRDFKNLFRLKQSFKNCDVVFDFTEGDSFSDLYGFSRFASTTLLKIFAIKKCGNLILGPQTYGPFDHKVVKYIAKYILKKSNYVFSRDIYSSNLVKEIANRDCIEIIDVAFALPYKIQSNRLNNKIKIGINVSGLLWNNDYDNKLNLKVKYSDYINQLISEYVKDNQYEIHLIPHVIAQEMVDDDTFVLNILKSKYPECKIAPLFENPISAKEYISSMDVFTGARMHATIAAFSSNTPVIPFSYSRKFEGLYNTLKYPYCINGRSLNAEEAFEKTKNYIGRYKELKEVISNNSVIATMRINEFKNILNDILCNLSDKGGIK